MSSDVKKLCAVKSASEHILARVDNRTHGTICAVLSTAFTFAVFNHHQDNAIRGADQLVYHIGIHPNDHHSCFISSYDSPVAYHHKTRRRIVS